MSIGLRPKKAIQCQVVDSLSVQACGGKADQIYRCEIIGPEGHRHRVGPHTILHDRAGNGYSCESIEAYLDKERA